MTINNHIKDIIVTLLIALFMTALSARAEGVKTYTVADGLLDSTINCIYQDNRGIMWFGSNKGITRFDGINFTTFKTSNANDRVAVLAIFQEKSGVMWVITEIGVLMWSGSDFKEIAKFHGLTSFCMDKSGNKWLGSKTGIIIFGEGLDEAESRTLSDIKNVNALFKDKNSDIWIGTDSGAYHYDGKNIEKYTTEEGLIGSKINAIYEEGSDIFFATDKGISYYNGMIWNSYTKSNGLADDFATCAFRDFRGKYWFGTKNGLSIYDESSVNLYDAWRTLTVADGIADNQITCLYPDGSANLWVGTRNGVTKYSISFDYLVKIQGVKEQITAPVFYDKQKNIWFSIEGGVASFYNNEFKRFKEEEGIASKVTTIYQNPEDDIIYFGTEYGFTEFEAGSASNIQKPLAKVTEGRYSEKGVFTYYEIFPEKNVGLAGRKVIALSKDADGNIWIATDMALNKRDVSTWTTYTTEEGLLGNLVSALLLSSDGTLYIATNRGINTYSDGEFGATITVDDGLASNNVRCMLQDKRGFLWFGTDKGVSLLKDGKIKNYTIDNGLGGDIISTIFQDKRGFLWFGTEGGVTKFDGENFSIFTTVDGLLVNDVKSIAQTADGILWFGTEFGVMRYQPDNVPPTSIVKNIPTEPIVLPKYSFEVTGADMNSSPHELLYSYKLDDGKWTKFKAQTVFYADELQNGTHKLSVRVKDKSLNIEKPPNEVTFEVNTKKFDIEIVDIKFETVFSVLYQYYNSMRDPAKDPLGQITLKNNFDKEIKVKINTFVKEYMDFPADTRGVVKPSETATLPLGLEFNENILTAPTGFKKANITLQYYLNGENKENEINSNIMIYDKNTITWDDPGKIGSFVTASEKTVTNFVRNVIQRYKDESKNSIIYGNLIRAMEIFDALGAYGIRYISDPTNPYGGLYAKKEAQDTLRFPNQTLKLKSGDCDDCVIMYCSMLENIGINTAAVDTGDHLFMMFDVGLNKKDLAQITDDKSSVFIDEDDKVWIPVETTLFGQTFTKAWESGANKINTIKNLRTYYLADAWKVYPPAELKTSDEEAAKIVAPEKSAIDAIYVADVQEQEGKLLFNLVSKYEKMIAEDPKNAQAYNSLGILYAKNGYLDKAEEIFLKVIELAPKYSGGHSNLGNILFEKEYYKEAVQEYKKSLLLNKNNANVYIELAITYTFLDDYGKAREAYLNAIKINPEIEKEF